MPAPRNTPLRAIDLFCGAGGLSQGFRDAGYEIPFALDFDEDSCETYRLNHPETHVENASIIDFDPAKIDELVEGKIDVVLGGPSCQSFSTAGRHYQWVSEKDERNDLWEHMFKVVEHVEPTAFLMENVPGMVYWKEGEFGDKILKRFASIGYTVKKDILLAADYGVPQRRRRLFIVGIRNGQAFEFPTPTHLGGWRRDTLDLWERKRTEQKKLKHITLADAISDLPPIINEGTISKSYIVPRDEATPFARYIRRGKPELREGEWMTNRANTVVRDHEVQKLGEEQFELLELVPAGGTWRDIPPHKLPDRYRGMRRTDSTNLLGRLEWNLPSYTVTTQFNNATTGCVTHPDETRTLSVREGARLQTFPDYYCFVGSLQSRCRQIGNAVPPLLGHVLAYELAKQIYSGQLSDLHTPAPIIKRSAKGYLAGTDELARARAKRRTNQDNQARVAVQEALAAAEIPYKLVKLEAAGARESEEIVLEAHKTVILVKGCFFHGCEKDARDTKSKSKWWAERIRANQERDFVSEREWKTAGYTVAEYWEHEDPADCARHIAELAEAASAQELNAFTAGAIAAGVDLDAEAV